MRNGLVLKGPFQGLREVLPLPGSFPEIERIFVRFQELTGFQGLLPPAPGEINACPAGKPIFLVPGALAVPQ